MRTGCRRSDHDPKQKKEVIACAFDRIDRIVLDDVTADNAMLEYDPEEV